MRQGDQTVSTVAAFMTGGGIFLASEWGIVLLFALGALLRTQWERPGRLAESSAWIAFGIFWVVTLPHIPTIAHSPLSALGTKGQRYVPFIAGPLCAYLGYLTWRDHPGFRTLARVTAIASLIYVPALTIRAVQTALINVTVYADAAVLSALGESPTLVPSAAGVRNTFLFTMPTGNHFALHVLLACTGIGSIAMATGLVVGVNGSLHQKLRVLSLTLPCIYIANVVRIVFIGVASGDQLLQIAPHTIMSIFGTTNPVEVSYYLADHVISQLGSIAILVALLIYALRTLSPLAVFVEDLFAGVTGIRLRLRPALR